MPLIVRKVHVGRAVIDGEAGSSWTYLANTAINT